MEIGLFTNRVAYPRSKKKIYIYVKSKYFQPSQVFRTFAYNLMFFLICAVTNLDYGLGETAHCFCKSEICRINVTVVMYSKDPSMA